jgi:hypothetical protein
MAGLQIVLARVALSLNSSFALYNVIGQMSEW